MGDRGAKATYSDGLAPRNPDRAIAELALDQHAVVALWQLVEQGVRARAVQRRAGTGRLHRIHEGLRDQRLMLAGYRVIRFPSGQVFEEPGAVAATLRQMLRRAA